MRWSSLWFRWQKISAPSSILELLKQVYVDPSTKVDKVFSRIVETTQHPAAAASFASIMFAPKGQLSFQEALSGYQIRCKLKSSIPHEELFKACNIYALNIHKFLTIVSLISSGCRCQMQDIPICLMYGKEDPWVRPVWGLKVKKQLPEVPYYEISPAGHCPHDEVPEVCSIYCLWFKDRALVSLVCLHRSL